MAEKITNYTCPRCGGPIHFDAASGKMKCDYCDSVYTVEEMKQYYAAQNAEKAGNEAAGEHTEDDMGEASAYGASAPNVETAGHKKSDGWSDANGHLKVYHCNHCGAELVCDESTAATTCPYCGNPTVIPGQFTVGQKPDYVIPFQWEKKQVLARLQEYYQGKKLLPKSFTSGNHLDQVQGVYVPYWLFNGSVDASMEFECGRTSVTREGDFEVRRTSLYDVRRAGTVSFAKIPCDASGSMPDDLMDSIEPFDYSGMKTFELEYLPGYLANKYDVDEKDLQKKADERAVNTAYQKLRNTVEGYSEVSERGRSARVTHRKTDYALLPVWLLYTKWEGKDFLFAMNGQSGKMTGNLPVDGKKAVGWFCGISALCFALFSLVMMLFYETESAMPFVVALLLSCIVGGVTVSAMVSRMKPVAAAAGAGHYVMDAESVLRVRTDDYVRTVETRTPIRTGDPNRDGPGGPRGGRPDGPHRR